MVTAISEDEQCRYHPGDAYCNNLLVECSVIVVLNPLFTYDIKGVAFRNNASGYINMYVHVG